MTGNTWASLRALLVARYDDLKHRLTRRLGSSDLAAEALQETWLRLDRPGAPTTIDRPDAYVYRVALNAAADRRRTDERRLALSEIELLRHQDDDEIDPERIYNARADIALLEKALDELPPRTRAIFMAARLEGTPHKVLAEQYGLSVRMIEREVRRALEHCSRRLGILSAERRSPPPEQSS